MFFEAFLIFLTAPQQNKLLMIARRTVADIPRDDLRKSDEEGDT